MNVTLILPASCPSRPFHARQDDLHTVAQQARQMQEHARAMIEAVERFQAFYEQMHNAGVFK